MLPEPSNKSFEEEIADTRVSNTDFKDFLRFSYMTKQIKFVGNAFSTSFHSGLN